MARNMRMVYAAWFGLISAAIVLQFYLAGYGVFGFSGLNGFVPHLVVGDVIGIAILIGIGLAFGARVPWRITGINGGLVVLMAIQAVLAHTGVQVISALHVVNGILIFGMSAYLTREAWNLVSLDRGAAPRQGAVTGAAPSKS
jgi:hypothetical protein